MESHSDESSTHSREIECETVSRRRRPPAASARVKLMCSYGGRILLRPHDNQIAYVGGETKILAVDRSIRFPAFLARVAALLPATADGDVFCFKYQLPGEDLDALISVTDDEDLDHMMIEYDRLVRLAARPSPRLRLFLFVSSSATTAAPLEEKKVVSFSATSPTASAPPEEENVVSFSATSPTAAAPPEEEKKLEQRQWFEDALSSPSASKQPPIHTVSDTPSPDFLFGLDKSSVPAPEPAVAAKEEPEAEIVCPPAVVSPSSSEIQRQIEELQRPQIAAENHQEMQRQQIAEAENHKELQRLQIAAANHQQQQQIAAAENHKELQRLQISSAANHHHQHQQQAANHHQHQQRQQIAAPENHQELQRLQIAAENHQELQRQQIASAANHQELQRLNIASAANQQHQQQAPIQRNGNSDDVMATTRVPAADYYMNAGPQQAAHIPAGYWAAQKPASGGAEQQAVFLIPAAPGLFPGQPGRFYAAVTRTVPAAAGGTAGYQVAYDSAGRAVYYRGAVVPTYQMAGPTSAGVGEDSKPAQVS